MARRKANGEGSIYKRKDGRWEGAVSVATTAGKLKRIHVYGATRQEADRKLTALKDQANRGIPVADHQWRLGDYIDYWLENVVKPSRRPKTFQQYESVSRLYLKPALGGVLLTRVSVPGVQTFINEQFVAAESQGHSRRKVHTMRAVLSAVLTRAMRDELVTRNVAQLVELQPAAAKKVQPWTADEANRFLEAARTEPLFPAFALLLLYGFRRGELLGLRWQDIDFAADEIHVRQQLQRVGRQLHFGPVKTTAGERDLPLLPMARQLLLGERESRQKVDGSGDLVFTARDSGPVRPEYFYRSFLRLCEVAGVRPIKVHHVRHTTATLLKKLKAPDRDIQTILGHSHVSVTQEIYQHADLEDRKVALAGIENLLLSSLKAEDDSSSCRQNCRQDSAYYERRTQERSSNRSFLGAGRGSRTPEDISRLIYRSIPTHLNDRLTSVQKIAKYRSRVWILGCAAVSVAVKDAGLESPV